MRIISSIYLLAFAFLLFSKNEFNERRIESHEFKGEKSVKSKFKAVSNVEFYSTIPLRESPYPDVIGVVRLTAEESSQRNHYRFEYDNNFQLVSVSIRLGDKLINPNHTSNYFFYYTRAKVFHMREIKK